MRVALLCLLSACITPSPWVNDDSLAESEAERAENARLIREQNLMIVAAAVAQLRALGPQRIDANFPDQCGAVAGLYTLSLGVNDQLQVGLGVHFVPETTVEDARVYYPRVLGCKDAMRELWQRYDIAFELRLTTSWDDGAAPDNAWITRIGGNTDRGDASNFTTNINSSCTTMMHELMHRLGLPDEYAEPGTCRAWDAPESRPSSVMEAAYSPIELVEIMPRQLSQLMSPLYDAMPECLIASASAPVRGSSERILDDGKIVASTPMTNYGAWARVLAEIADPADDGIELERTTNAHERSVSYRPRVFDPKRWVSIAYTGSDQTLSALQHELGELVSVSPCP